MTRPAQKKPARKVASLIRLASDQQNDMNQQINAAAERVKVAPPLEHARIADLLAQSRSEHRRYRDELTNGTAAGARAALQSAFDLRLQAEELDPGGVSPSWNEEGPYKAQHYALLKFYSEKLA